MKTRKFKSNATSPGIAIGKAYRLHNHGASFFRTWIRDQDIENEIKRFKKAITLSKEQLVQIQAKMCRYEGHEQINILESQRMLLQDEMLIKNTVKTIEDLKINAEWALDQTLGHLSLSFLNVREEYFRERKQDINYAGRRVMNNLTGQEDISFNNLPDEPLILISHDLSPAEIAALPKNKVKGFVMEVGGATSHSAIIAKALEIPAIFGVKNIIEQIQKGEKIILDGIKGILIASPIPSELKQYQDVQKRYLDLEKILLKDIDLPTQTKDGFQIKLEANMEIIEEIPSILEHGAEGIGLYRTEYLFLNRFDEPSEEEQFNNYVEILKKIKPKSVTVRTVDLGADKLPLGHGYELQTNPALGLRAIRLCFRELPLFKTQLRALLRASIYGNLKILLPLISSVEEIIEIKKIIKSIKSELTSKKIKFNNKVPLGIMIEIPAAAIIAPFLAKHVDFFSIGTNDLIQYGLAVDRANELVSDLYDPYHPAIIQMVSHTVKAAKKAKIPVSLCGEMGADPSIIPLLVGMGIDSLSMNSISIPRVKRMLRDINKDESSQLTEKILNMSTAKEIKKTLKKYVK